MSRTEFDPDDVGHGAFYQLMTATIVPRPIAWVSSTSPEGVDNIAPHSFYTVACVSPPVIQFTSVGRKDTVNNIEASGEFVVCFTPEHLFEQVNASGTSFPPGTSEFDAVGLEREASTVVGPPRVRDSPVAFECKLHSMLAIGNSVVVLGNVVSMAVDDDVLIDDHPEITKLKPLSRLGKIQWGTHGELRDIPRIPVDEWPGHYRRS